MKPVAIVRVAPSEGPGYFDTYLRRRSIASKLIALDAGEAVPRDPRRYSGLVFMGGPMSVNDELPWIAPVIELIREAVRKDVPVLGHCLGGQLMSKAFGGAVRANPVREIGWGEVRVCDNEVARDWLGSGLGSAPAFEVFHWHEETFSIPPGATRVLENANCANQAFAIGKHLGMQCHVEMTEELIRSWTQGEAQRERIELDMQKKLERLHAVADRLYDRWTEGLSRGS